MEERVERKSGEMPAKRIRVIHIAECIGGVDRFLRCLLKYSDKDKFENIMILSQLYEKEVYEKLADHVEIMRIPHSTGLSAFSTAIELRKKIKEYKPDVVCAHSSIAGAMTRMACLGLKCKVVYNPHGWSFNMENEKKNTFILLEKLMAHFCDAIICISEAEKVSALREGICVEKKLRVINNGIDLDREIGPCPIKVEDDLFVVGMVGRICRQKAPDVFVKMAGEIKKKVDRSLFIIVGDVLEAEQKKRIEIENLAEEQGIELIITGWVDNPLDYVSRFDVGCLLSRWEGFGLAIPEYMLCGVPIVATKVDAIPYLIRDGETGYLVEKDDWKSAADKVLEARENKEMIDNEKKELERFDARRVSKEYEGLFGALVNEYRKSY